MNTRHASDDELIGTAIDSSGSTDLLGLNPKDGSIANLKFIESSDDSVVKFQICTRFEESMPSTDDFLKQPYLGNEYPVLQELYEIDTKEDLFNFAKRHGPLFGLIFYNDGFCSEPIEMWRAAIDFFKLAFTLKAAQDSKEWQDISWGEFKSEYYLSDEQVEAIQSGADQLVPSPTQEVTHALIIASSGVVPFKYQELILNDSFSSTNRAWRDRRWDEQAFSRNEWSVSPDECYSTLSTYLDFNPKHRDFLIGSENLYDTKVLPFNLKARNADEILGKLCRNALEALISMHTRNMHYGWSEHEYKPVFYERVRYFWYMFALYEGKANMRFCQNCSRPFISKRKDQKYCGNDCKTAYNKRRRQSSVYLHDLYL